ncbi:MAG: hypothetical protein NTY81_03480 [Candidatus Staskawiczbacteria bacterium]|nr:hypothetical protein [Candidatus Staskawiczbacteria bacterium]
MGIVEAINELVAATILGLYKPESACCYYTNDQDDFFIETDREIILHEPADLLRREIPDLPEPPESPGIRAFPIPDSPDISGPLPEEDHI